MSITLPVSSHVLLLLVGTFFYYAALLNLLSRKEVSKRALVWKTSFGFLSILGAWFIELIFLEWYFVGKLGYVTDNSIVSFVPTLVLVRELLFPFVLTFGLIISFVVLFKASYLLEREHLKMLLLLFVAVVFAGTFAVALLGVLVP